MVEIAYAALNFFDTLIIEGKYQVKPEPPFSPGGEFSGRIVALGPRARGFTVGDRVMGSSGYGAARERIAIPASRLVRVPDGLPLDKAAGLSIAYGTTIARAQAAGGAAAGRNAGRARRLGRRRARRGRDRRRHGGARHRLRLVGR